MREENKLLVLRLALKTAKGEYPSINSFEFIDWIIKTIK